MQDNSFNVVFTHDDKVYKGWATPSTHKKEDGSPTSFHVVLNGVLFGNVSHNNNTWAVDEERPDDLTASVGMFIEKNYH